MTKSRTATNYPQIINISGLQFTIAPYVPVGIQKTEDIDIPLDSKPLSKRSYVCLQKSVWRNL